VSDTCSEVMVMVQYLSAIPRVWK